MDQFAFNVPLSSDPGEAMDRKDKLLSEPSAKAEMNKFISREAWMKFPRKIYKTENQYQ